MSNFPIFNYPLYIYNLIRVAVILVPFLFLTNVLLARSTTDSLDYSSFRKGRNLVGISGSISSSGLSNANSNAGNTRLGNLYRFDIKLGKFIANRNLVGIQFHASRTHLVGFVDSKAEGLGLGPWYRLYIGKDPNIALYLQTTLMYANYFSRSSVVAASYSLNEELELQGIRGSLGLGICYVMTDRIAFEVGCDYNQARYWGSLTDFIGEEKRDITLNRGELVFTFGFTIFFRKMKADD